MGGAGWGIRPAVWQEGEMSPRQLLDKAISAYVETQGGREIHRAWRDSMMNQGRKVSPEKLEWETLPYQDKMLDEQIAEDLLRDFSVFFLGHYIT